MQKYISTFRRESEKLTALFATAFKSAEEVKSFIEQDAEFFCAKNPGSKLLGWQDEDCTDYFAVSLKNGRKCFWQYFKAPC